MKYVFSIGEHDQELCLFVTEHGTKDKQAVCHVQHIDLFIDVLNHCAYGFGDYFPAVFWYVTDNGEAKTVHCYEEENQFCLSFSSRTQVEDALGEMKRIKKIVRHMKVDE